VVEERGILSQQKDCFDDTDFNMHTQRPVDLLESLGDVEEWRNE